MNKMEKIKLTFVGLRPAVRAMVNKNLALDKRVINSSAKAMKSLQNKIDKVMAAKESMKKALEEKKERVNDKTLRMVHFIKNVLLSNTNRLYRTVVTPVEGESYTVYLRGWELRKLKENDDVRDFSIVTNRFATIGEFFKA